MLQQTMERAPPAGREPVAMRLLESMARAGDGLRPAFQLATRGYVSWQFLKSGWLKVTNWPGTLDLFREEYHVPVLSPHAAAVTGACAELFLPVLVTLGVGGRTGPVSLFVFNVMAVVSYRQVLLAEGAEAALAQHVLWGFMLATLIVFGNGPWSVDRLFRRRL